MASRAAARAASWCQSAAKTGQPRRRGSSGLLLRLYPRQLLGAIPLLFSWELVADSDDVSRTWSSLLNAFLHPAMERFLFSAERRLREHRTRRPLLIFRNDGGSSRVAKSAALKTYSSGPRGGLEGTRALARQLRVAARADGRCRRDHHRHRGGDRRRGQGRSSRTDRRRADFVRARRDHEPRRRRKLGDPPGRRPDRGRPGERRRRPRARLLRPRRRAMRRSPTSTC